MRESPATGARALRLAGPDSGTDSSRLFCIHGLFLYRQLATTLCPACTTYGVYLEPDRESRAAPASWLSVERLAAQYLHVVREVDPVGPYRLLGACFGGVVAFEMALQLRRDGAQVDLVAMLESRDPTASSGPPVPVRAARRAFDRLRTGRGEVGDRLAAERAALDRYRPGAYAGTLVCLEGQQFHQSEADSVSAWRRLASGRVDLHVLPAGYESMLTPPFVGDVGALLGGYLSHRVSCRPAPSAR